MFRMYFYDLLTFSPIYKSQTTPGASTRGRQVFGNNNYKKWLSKMMKFALKINEKMKICF